MDEAEIRAILKAKRTAHEDEKGIELSSVRVDFNDPFSPSSSVLQTSNPDFLNTPQSRFYIYNVHLIEIMDFVVDAAVLQGCPRVPFTLARCYARIDDELFHSASAKIGELIGGVTEQSENWLLLRAYYCWVAACNAHSKGKSPAVVATWMMQVGAAVKELELVWHNREDAIKSKDRTTRLRNQNKDAAKAKTQKTLAWKTDAKARAEKILEENPRFYGRWSKLAEEIMTAVAELEKGTLKNRETLAAYSKKDGLLIADGTVAGFLSKEFR